jgi:hypothetical protein
MEAGLFRAVETLFTAYAVPALMVPFVWVACRFARNLAAGDSQDVAGELFRLETLYALVAAVWLGGWLVVCAGVPIERGGLPLRVLAWAAYGLLNAVFAWLLVKVTADYGRVREERDRDRLFMRFLCVVVAQPFTTGCAFAVLYRIMGVAYERTVPGLPGIQEGI